VSKTHGMRNSPEYASYTRAKHRCADKHNARYGGRGIQFLFTSFEQFYAEMGPRPAGTSVDRIRSNGNYEPGNVKWATPKEQANNRCLDSYRTEAFRKSVSRRFRGKRKSKSQRRKMSAARKRQVPPFLGRKHKPETIVKMRRPKSPETIERMRLAAIRRWDETRTTTETR
jgi:hypothetical protein